MASTARTLADQSLTTLKGVGKQLAARLEKLGLMNLQDLLFHLPYRYIDRTRVTPIYQLQSLHSAVIEGEVRGVDIVYGRRRSLVCHLQDHTGSLLLRFYHFGASQKQTLSNARRLRVYGELRPGVSGLEIYHPEYQVLDGGQPAPPLETTLTPAYHTTEGITQPRLRGLIEQVFACATEDNLPDLLARDGSPPLLKQLHYLHYPPKDAPLELLLAGEHPYQQQLIYEELTAYQVSLLRLRSQRRRRRALALPAVDKYIKRFMDALDFRLTEAQRRVCREISADLSQTVPMMRLLQGDVGAGKTVVAATAVLQAVAAGKQAAVMVPTDILAEQHRVSFQQWLTPLNIHVGWLSGKQKASDRRQQLATIAEGQTQVVIGTHALFQDEVRFHGLALVIIDEQHRFGVHQRLQLWDKGRATSDFPHQLIMTATPIPRTLAMSAYADLDYSVLDQLPAGRQPVKTVVISQQRRSRVIERISHACLEGRQAYWVCTLIEQSEMLSAKSAADTVESLKEALPELCIALIHGRLKSKDKETVMQRFKRGEVDLLVATTVIEVGVDIPNASLMVIENPERLGLAQLHQLRGRVGRGDIASHCVLLYGEPLSAQSRARLQAMRETNDGFRIAEIDLRLRGPGEVLGTRQTGDVNFKLADLERDLSKLPRVKQQAQQLLVNHPHTAAKLVIRWLGGSEQFAQV